MGSSSSKSSMEVFTKSATEIAVKQWSSCSNTAENTQDINMEAEENIIMKGAKFLQSQKNTVNVTCMNNTSNDADLKTKIAAAVANKANAESSGFSPLNLSKAKSNTKVHDEISTKLDISQIRNEANKIFNAQKVNVKSSKGSIDATDSTIDQSQVVSAISSNISSQLGSMSSVVEAAKKLDAGAVSKAAGFGGAACGGSSLCILLLAGMVLYAKKEGMF